LNDIDPEGDYGIINELGLYEIGRVCSDVNAFKIPDFLDPSWIYNLTVTALELLDLPFVFLKGISFKFPRDFAAKL
jgi:hypothetical protein